MEHPMSIFVCLHCGRGDRILGDAPREPECDCGAVMEPEANLADAIAAPRACSQSAAFAAVRRLKPWGTRPTTKPGASPRRDRDDPHPRHRR